MSRSCWACGFNAHGQLTGHNVEDDPHDVHELCCLLTGNSIRILFLGWADSLLQVDEDLVSRGGLRDGVPEMVESEVSPSKILSGVGDETGLKGVVTDEGELWMLERLNTDDHGRGSLRLRRSVIQSLTQQRGAVGQPLHHLVVAGNGRVCASFGCVVVEYPSWASLCSDDASSMRHRLPAAPAQLRAGATSFCALLPESAGGSMYTWGDARHNHLGRVVSEKAPAAIPMVVDHLTGIPVKKMAMGGWITAAVSTSHDLYLWGGRPGEEPCIRALPDRDRVPDDNAEVVLVDIDPDPEGAGRDVVDVGVGAGHVVVLADDGTLWAAGRGHNGQLGRSEKGDAEDWIEMRRPSSVENGVVRHVESIHCGPANTVVVVKNRPATRVEQSD